MPPFILTLLAQGLGLLGNAVLAKGKDVIEEKLGVNIEELSQTPEGILKLKALELEHEQFLLTNALEDKKLGMQDTASARDMNTRNNESEYGSWLSKNIVAILALIVVLGGGSIVVWSPAPDVRTAAVGIITMVLGFYFGSTKNSRTKDETIANLTHQAGNAK